MPPIVSVVGKSGSGKTTLIVKLILELKRRGYRIGTVKHASHGFEMDHQGKDSWRHKAAGADTVIVAAPDKIALETSGSFDSLDFLEGYTEGLDLVLTEGYKRQDKPKVEIFRRERHQVPLGVDEDQLVAFVTNANTDAYPNTPRFGLDDTDALADFLEARFLTADREEA
jgi:molybdopterin-guanine dinucleotide biosynthesis protein MobB